jgi:uncharacterized Zn-binding protein involved in type VI secretion
MIMPFSRAIGPAGLLIAATIAILAPMHAAPTWAQADKPQSPGIILEGSGNTTVGGGAAARVGDRSSSGSALVQGSPNVTINGRPAVTMGDQTGCGGITIGGGSSVFINGKPVARAGDLTSGCPGK